MKKEKADLEQLEQENKKLKEELRLLELREENEDLKLKIKEKKKLKWKIVLFKTEDGAYYTNEWFVYID